MISREKFQKNFPEERPQSKHGTAREGTSDTNLRGRGADEMQFARQTSCSAPVKCECLMKVFNTSVENIVEKDFG